MVKKITKYLKFVVCCALILSLIAPSYAALSASDGSAFVTKAEFDSALADFNARLTTFEAGINSKIDSQVTSYLDRNGIWNGNKQLLHDDSLYSVCFSGWDFEGNETTGELACKKVIDVSPDWSSWKAPVTRFGDTPGDNVGLWKIRDISEAVDSVAMNTYIIPLKNENHSKRKYIISNITKSGLLMFDWALRADSNSEYSLDCNHYYSTSTSTWARNWCDKRKSLQTTGKADQVFDSFKQMKNSGTDQAYKRFSFMTQWQYLWSETGGGFASNFEIYKVSGSQEQLIASEEVVNIKASDINVYRGDYGAIANTTDGLKVGTTLAFVEKGDSIVCDWYWYSYGRFCTRFFMGPNSKEKGGNVIYGVFDNLLVY